MASDDLPHPANLGPCQAVACDAPRAIGVCPCGLRLCKKCLERHAHYGRYLRAAHPAVEGPGKEEKQTHV